MWKTQPPGNLRACPDVYRDCCTFFYLFLPIAVSFSQAWTYNIHIANYEPRNAWCGLCLCKSQPILRGTEFFIMK